MLNLKKLIVIIIATAFSAVVMAQNTALGTPEDKGGFMRSDGKIYVVVAIVLTILAGLFIYVARLDRKITKLEKGGNP